ncbi:MAG: 16S rRNA (adenine(1518)-N(6)/adenine(1519)-N(6))-dimethyltransferase RsmA [Firmicutes bacterium]|nr:16S rRNA (adenine(1518)-N(6)/adenine(1519)-N(6))-dimethyltransferase RsmA [Bacillota bacterium]
MKKEIATPGSTGRLLKRLQKKPEKRLGQNFLVDRKTALDIAASLPEDREDAAPVIIEIGAGLGALSQLLAARAGRLILLEIDPALASHLRQMFAACPQVSVVQQDALQADFDALAEGAAYHVFGNLPYHITSELAERMAGFQGWQSVTFLLQKEAAERLLSGPGRQNCPLALHLAYCSQGRCLFDVPPAAFHPMPQVDSAVIQLRRRPSPPTDLPWEKIEPLIRAAFTLRRKSLLNALTASPIAGDKPYWQQMLNNCGIDPQTRGEALSLEDFNRLALAVYASELASELS